MPRRQPASLKQRVKPWEPSTEQLEAYAMVCEGVLTQKEIGKKYRRAQSTIAVWTKRIDAWLAPQLMDSIREIKAQHTSRLMHIYTEAMRAWERSKQDYESETTSDWGEGSTTTTTRRGQCGNSAYLSEARAALSEIRTIWGADAPIEVRHSGEIRVAGRTQQDIERDLLNQLDQRRQQLVQVNQN